MTGEKKNQRLLRLFIGVAVICAAVYYYYYSYTIVQKKLLKKESQFVTVKETVLAEQDFFRDTFFYKTGEGGFDIDTQSETIIIKPHDDFFVSLSHQEKLDGKDMEKLSLSFEYQYKRSGNSNPQQQAGMVLILISKKGYRSIHTTFDLCKAARDGWRECSMTIENPGSPRFAVIRMGATSYHREVGFKNISLTRTYRQKQDGADNNELYPDQDISN